MWIFISCCANIAYDFIGHFTFPLSHARMHTEYVREAAVGGRIVCNVGHSGSHTQVEKWQLGKCDDFQLDLIASPPLFSAQKSGRTILRRRAKSAKLVSDAFPLHSECGCFCVPEQLPLPSVTHTPPPPLHFFFDQLSSLHLRLSDPVQYQFVE